MFVIVQTNAMKFGIATENTEATEIMIGWPMILIFLGVLCG